MVRVAWGELSCLDRNGLITGYVVEVSLDDEIVNTVDIVDSSMTTTLTGLLPLRTYYVRVAAVTDQGIGPHSTELAVTTPLTSTHNKSNISSFISLCPFPLTHIQFPARLFPWKPPLLMQPPFMSHGVLLIH